MEINSTNYLFIAGGTGLVPIYDIIQSLVKDDKDKVTKIRLMNSNRTSDDMFYLKELESLAQGRDFNIENFLS